MRCRKVQRLMSAHLDKELPPGKQAGLESHLNHCEACAAKFRASREMQQLLAGTERFAAPAGFSRLVMARLDPAEAARPFFTPLWLRFAEVAVVLLVIGSGLVFGRLLSLPAGRAGLESASAGLSLDLFAPAPAGSLGGVYLAMLEDGHAQ